MGILYIIGAICTMAVANTSKKWFTKNCPIFFSSVCCFFALLVFVFVSGFKLDFNLDFLPYSLFFAIVYSLCTVFLTLALKRGSLSLSGLIMSYSLILPTLYGIIFLSEQPSIFFYIGFVILIVSIFLVNAKKDGAKKDGEDNKKDGIIWLIFIGIAFITNGFCSIIQTAEQKAFDGNYKNEYMIVSLAISFVVLLIVSAFTEKKEIKGAFSSGCLFGSISGISNGLLNLFVMLSVNVMPASIVFTLISGGSLLLMFILARVVFKEKYTKLQYLGFFVGIISVVLLNC